MKHLKSARCPSPIGELTLLVDGDDNLCYLDFADNAARQKKLLTARYGAFSIAAADLNPVRERVTRYFAGQWDAFAAQPLCTDGSDFQRAVWRGLHIIRTGKTLSYVKLARLIRRPNAARAVAAACARNPIAIVIPCHRVIGADGALRGYAGGTARKSWLLTHEGYPFLRQSP